MASRRETILQGIATALEAIIGNTAFENSGLRSVQRKLHTWNGENHDVNTFADSPAIFVHCVNEDSTDEGSMQSWQNRMIVDLWWVTLGSASDDTAISSALADMKKALFLNWTGVNLYGVPGCTVRRMSNNPIGPERGGVQDGILLSLEVEYEDRIGDPATE